MKNRSVKTFFWDGKVTSPSKLLIRKLFRLQASHFFKVGNAGDLFTHELIHYLYKEKAQHTEVEMNRMLCVGSIAHYIQDHDILCGIGIKDHISKHVKDKSTVQIFGLRGPITYDQFKKEGYYLGDIKFLMDPGLMIRFMYDHKTLEKEQLDDVIFIPHYRERFIVKKMMPKSMKFIDIDTDTINIIKAIYNAKMVYTSSLHGLIFSHALNRPCVLVHPQTDEPLTKFKDYFASMNLPFKEPLRSILDVQFKSDSDTTVDLKYNESDFTFPSFDHLIANKVII